MSELFLFGIFQNINPLRFIDIAENTQMLNDLIW